MKKIIAVIEGDGIGVEVAKEGVNALKTIANKYNHEFIFNYYQAGGCAIDEYGVPLPDETLDGCKNADAVLLGAVGGPKWDVPGAKVRPEQALLGIRKGLNLYANLRPATLYGALKDASPLKPEIIGDKMDLMVVRELTGGIYFGKSGRDGDTAYDTEEYSKYEIERIAKIAFDTAMKRAKKLMVVDKANILESSRLWREVISEISPNYPEIEVSFMYVDNASMQLVRNPKQFDVILTSNMFGDILSDEASIITGSIGMLASASLGDGKNGMYEPIHGSAPDIAGLNKANPIATIMSAAMMLDYSFGLKDEAEAIAKAVEKVLDMGYRTGDIFTEGMKLVGTTEMGKLICENI